MSIFNTDSTHRVPFTAQSMADWKSWSEEHPNDIGRINGWWEYGNPNINLFDVTKSKLDDIIDSVLVYIYYYTKLGINELQLNKFQIGVSTLVFGVSTKNWKSEPAVKIMDYVIKEFEKRGFEVTHNPNDSKITIGWYQKVFPSARIII